jgi:hypothetical protein
VIRKSLLAASAAALLTVSSVPAATAPKIDPARGRAFALARLGARE